MEWNLIEGDGGLGPEDRPVSDAAEEQLDYRVEIAFHELEIVAYVGQLKIVGLAHFGHTGRAGSQRSSDYLRRFADSRLTLSNVRIYRHDSNELIDTTAFTILNLDRVDLVYAREVGSAVKGDPALGARTPPDVTPGGPAAGAGPPPAAPSGDEPGDTSGA